MLFEILIKNGTLRIKITAPMVLVIWAILTGKTLLIATDLDPASVVNTMTSKVFPSVQTKRNLKARSDPIGRRQSQRIDGQNASNSPGAKSKNGRME